MKKIFLYIFIYFICVKIFAIDFSIEQLFLLAEKNNSDIIMAELNYKNAELSREGLNASYVPSFEMESSTTNTDKYKWNKIPDSFNSSISVNQQLPGGTSLGVTGSYSFISTDINQERFVSQKPSVIFSLTQSLYPFWIQGYIKDPLKLSLEQQKKFYFNQLIYAKKQILQNIVQNFYLSLIYQRQIESYSDSILFIEEQIANLEQLQKNGSINSNQILELETLKITYQQDKIETESNLYSCIQFLENICCTKIDVENLIINHPKNIFSDKEFLESNPLIKYDPYQQSLLLKIDMIKSSVILEKQSSAPVLSVFFSPNWQLEPVKSFNLKKGWVSSESNWTAGISVDLSPWFAYLERNEAKKNGNELFSAQKNYNAYLNQKEAIKNYYSNLVDIYSKQKYDAEKICIEIKNKVDAVKKQLDLGSISILDYKNVYNQYQKTLSMLYCTEKYFELYKSMQKFYDN